MLLFLFPWYQPFLLLLLLCEWLSACPASKCSCFAFPQPDIYPGNCWAFKGSQGYLVVRLSMEIHPTSFTLEHIPKTLSPTGNITSAPKDFSVYVSVLAPGGPRGALLPAHFPLERCRQRGPSGEGQVSVMEEHLPHRRGVVKALNKGPGGSLAEALVSEVMEMGFPRSCWRDAVRWCHFHDPVTIWFCFQGLENEYQEEGQLLGQFMFDQEGESLQTFPVPVSTCHTHWSPAPGPSPQALLP